jgi:4-azaleucine resistance transporter AzlC
MDRTEFRRGFVAIMPLWLGSVPFALAFALLARERGLSALETWALSAIVFAGAAQLAFIDLVGEHASEIAILGTVLLLNLRHVLYGLSLNEHLPAKTEPPRPALAVYLTDESYGITIRDYLAGRGSPGFLFGASASLYLCFMLSVTAGVLFGGLIPDPERIGLPFVFPLAYLALLLPMIRSKTDVLIALVAASASLIVGRFAGGGITILISTSAAAALGATLRQRERASA